MTELQLSLTLIGLNWTIDPFVTQQRQMCWLWPCAFIGTPVASENTVWLCCHRFGMTSRLFNHDCVCVDVWMPLLTGLSGVRGGHGTKPAQTSPPTAPHNNKSRSSCLGGKCHISWWCNNMVENTPAQRTIQLQLHNSSMPASVTTRILVRMLKPHHNKHWLPVRICVNYTSFYTL